MKSIYEIHTNGPPRPYVMHKLKIYETISFVPTYREDKENLLNWIKTLICVFEDRNATIDPQLKVTKLMLSKSNMDKFDRRL